MLPLILAAVGVAPQPVLSTDNITMEESMAASCFQRPDAAGLFGGVACTLFGLTLYFLIKDLYGSARQTYFEWLDRRRMLRRMQVTEE